MIINIQGLDRAVLLAALYNRSKPVNMGFLDDKCRDELTASEARHILAQDTHGQIAQSSKRSGFVEVTRYKPEDQSGAEGCIEVNGIWGRHLGVRITGNEMDVTEYDKFLGAGTAKAVVDALYAGQKPPVNMDNLVQDIDAFIAGNLPESAGGMPMSRQAYQASRTIVSAVIVARPAFVAAHKRRAQQPNVPS